MKKTKMKLAKKTLLSVLIVLLTVITSSAQKVIINPVFGSATDASIKIERIQLDDTTTSLFFKVTYQPGFWINIDSNSHLQTSDGSRKYCLLATKGLEVGLNKKWTMPDSGVVHYVLIFPKLDSGTNTFDFIENEKSSWKIFGIKLISKNTFLPKELMGNWITKDNSGKWLLGLYDSIAIYNNNIWHYDKVTNENGWAVKLKNTTTTTTIYLQCDKNGDCFVGSTAFQKVLCSHSMININYRKTTPQSAAFPTPFFAKGYATLRGYVEGYSPKVTKYADTYSIVAGSHVKKLQMADDGSFEVRIPICHPGIYPVRIPLLYANEYHAENVYLEPGQETVCYFSLFNFPPTATSEKFANVRVLYMGGNADVNNELYQYLKKSSSAFQTLTSTDSTEEYQQNIYNSNVLKIKRKEDEWVLNHLSTDAISEKTAKIIQTQINNIYCNYLVNYNTNREYKYKSDNHITDYSKDYLTPVPLTPTCISTIKNIFRDTLNLMGKESAAVLRIVENLPEVKKPNYSLLSVMTLMKNNGTRFTKDEQAIYNWFDDIHKLKVDAADSLDHYQALINKFRQKYANTIGEISEKLQNQTPQQFLKSYFDLPDFVLDVMNLNNAVNRFNLPMASPLEKDVIKDLKKKFSNPIFFEFVEMINKEVGAALTENKGSVIKDSRDLESENIYESLIKSHRGNVILLDFWETWCIPCRNGMLQMAPLKEELKDSGIAFVCVASPSSPEETWSALAKNIRGYHYKLNTSQYSAFYYRFNLKSIPRYILINKEGKIVNNDLGHKTNEELKALLLKLKNE